MEDVSRLKRASFKRVKRVRLARLGKHALIFSFFA